MSPWNVIIFYLHLNTGGDGVNISVSLHTSPKIRYLYTSNIDFSKIEEGCYKGQITNFTPELSFTCIEKFTIKFWQEHIGLFLIFIIILLIFFGEVFDRLGRKYFKGNKFKIALACVFAIEIVVGLFSTIFAYTMVMSMFQYFCIFYLPTAISLITFTSLFFIKRHIVKKALGCDDESMGQIRKD